MNRRTLYGLPSFSLLFLVYLCNYVLIRSSVNHNVLTRIRDINVAVCEIVIIIIALYMNIAVLNTNDQNSYLNCMAWNLSLELVSFYQHLSRDKINGSVNRGGVELLDYTASLTVGKRFFNCYNLLLNRDTLFSWLITRFFSSLTFCLTRLKFCTAI